MCSQVIFLFVMWLQLSGCDLVVTLNSTLNCQCVNTETLLTCFVSVRVVFSVNILIGFVILLGVTFPKMEF